MRWYIITLYTLEQFEIQAYTLIEAAEKATVYARENYPSEYDILKLEVVLGIGE